MNGLVNCTEFGFVTLPSGYVTGSSIMPNKRNPDTAELLRGQHAVVQGALAELQGALSLPSGYHRDLQLTKPPLIRAFEAGLRALSLLPDMIDAMALNVEAMAGAIDADQHATDVAIDASWTERFGSKADANRRNRTRSVK